MATKAGRCSVCGRPIEPAWRPFCSKRCANVDLGRWLGERYVVTEPADPDDEAERPGDDE
jgi:endogenous inhibitor of DNA gyrase (YacG/DUF329 family)